MEGRQQPGHMRQVEGTHAQAARVLKDQAVGVAVADKRSQQMSDGRKCIESQLLGTRTA